MEFSMLKRRILGLIIGLFISHFTLSSSSLNDYKGYLAVGVPGMQLLMSLNSDGQADFNNIAIVEYLLASKNWASYQDLIGQSLEDKKRSLQGHLTGVTSSSVVTPVVTSTADDLLPIIIASTGFSEAQIRQRLLNNITVLECLLAILGQSYIETINSSLFDKQKTLKDLGTTNKLLGLLLENGYTQDQLVSIIKNSNEAVPIKMDRHFSPIAPETSGRHTSREFPSGSEISSGVIGGDGDVAQRIRILELVQALAPELYAELIIFDSTGVQYIKTNYSGLAAVQCDDSTGYPIILVSKKFMEIPWNQQLFIIAHELGHWVLGHNGLGGANNSDELQEQFSKFLSKISAADRQLHRKNPKLGLGYGRDLEIKGEIKRLKGHPLPMDATFDKAYMRDNEFAADRFAVMDLGVDPEDGIAWMRNDLIDDKIGRTKDSELNRLFSRTHPFTEARIAQMEELKRELRLGMPRFYPQEINWHGLIAGKCAQYKG